MPSHSAISEQDPEVHEPVAAIKRWYSDPVALLVVLAIHGYPLSAIVATAFGVAGDSAASSYVIRAVTVVMAAVILMGGARLASLDLWLALFGFIYLVRLIYDTAFVNGDGASTALIFFLLSCLIPSLALALTRLPFHERNVLTGLSVTGVLIVIGTIAIVVLLPGGANYFVENGRLGFEKLNPISLAHVAVTTSLACLILYGSQRSHVRRLFIALLIVSAIVVMVMTGSRGPLIAYGICLLLMLAFRGQWHVIILAGVAAVAAYQLFDLTTLFDLARLDETGEGDSSLGRKFRLQVAFWEIVDHWQLGSSFTLPNSLEQPHNVIVEAWLATGIVGFTLFVAVILRGLFAALGALSSQHSIIALLYIQTLVGAQFSGAIYSWEPLWISLALLLGHRVHAGHEPEMEVDSVSRATPFRHNS